ncbi:MAG: hypothetical protein JNL11_17350 [Bdellovibrionaceae bacterium]|nr:hypothetical protein [Pseudobdellovibrionaceae bacterium]
MRVHERYLDQMVKKSTDGDSLRLKKAKSQFPIKEHTPQIKIAKKNRRQNSFSPMAIVITMFGICIAYFGYENIESIEKWLGSVQFSFMTMSSAEEKSATPAPLAAQAKHDSVDAKSKSEESRDVESSRIDFDFVKDFKERKKALDQKEEDLKNWEAEIQNQKTELDSKIVEIQKIRKDISAQLDDRVKADQAKLDTLVQVYSQMKATQAAKVFETLDEDLAVDILTKMKKKNAADILNLLKADKAQILSEKFAGYSRKPAQIKNEHKTEGAPVEATKP